LKNGHETSKRYCRPEPTAVVPGGSLEAAVSRPAAISIHDDGDMFWKEVRFEFRGQFVLG